MGALTARPTSPGTHVYSLGYPAFWRLAARHWRTGLGEIVRSLSKSAFVRALQRLVPDLRAEHLQRGPAGVRAQALAATRRATGISWRSHTFPTGVSRSPA